MTPIKRVAVLGSGVMGAAIAAHLANCGIPSLMLDIVPPNLPEGAGKDKRNAFADGAKAALLKSKPSPVYSKTVLDLIEIGNFEDDMPRIAECDWIIEAVKDDLSIKKGLFKRVAQHRRAGSIISSNTSGIPIRSMAESMSDEMSQHFLGTHFFNPPRYLKLLEIIRGPQTLPEVVEVMARFAENVLGKGVVYAKDSPGFIGNRIMTFAMQWTLHSMAEAGMAIEEIDALTGPAIGHASSATFRTADLVGLDVSASVVKTVREGAPDDERIDLLQGPAWVEKMLEKGLLGEKKGQGFYRKSDRRDEKGKTIIQVIDPATLEYRDPIKVRFDSTGAVRNLETLEDKLRVMYGSEDRGSQYLQRQFAHVAHYTANRLGEVADDIVNIDNASKWGFAWEAGIFETWDILGFDIVAAKMEAEGLQLPPIAQAMRETGATSFYKEENGRRLFFDLATKSYLPVPVNPNELRLNVVKQDKARVVKQNEGADLLDLGDGILCAAFHTKMNAIDQDILTILDHAVNLLEEDKFQGLVIGNQEPHFCAGANLFLILGEIMQGNWTRVEEAVSALQNVNMRMKYCSKPVVAAPHHYTFGGGVELCQHAARCVIAGETYAGLVEVGVGLVPAGGGTKEMLVRAMEYIPPGVQVEPFPFIRRAFENIATAKVGTSGLEMIEFGYLRTSDIVLPNYDHQIQKAKQVCLGLAISGYTPPQPPRLVALGEPVRAAFRAGVWGMQQGGFASEHDAVIAEKVAHILTGGNRFPGTKITEQDVLDLEREAFVSLCGTEKTQARMQHMLVSGKPLRN